MKTLVSGNCSCHLQQAKRFKPASEGPRCCTHGIHSLPVLGWSVFQEYQRCRLIHWRQLMMWWQEQAPGSHSQTAILIHVTDQNTCYCIVTADTVLDYPSGIRCNVCTKWSASTELYLASLFFKTFGTGNKATDRKAEVSWFNSLQSKEIVPFSIARTAACYSVDSL